MSSFPLESVEKAGKDEPQATRLKRMWATLAQTYDNTPVYLAKFDAARV